MERYIDFSDTQRRSLIGRFLIFSVLLFMFTCLVPIISPMNVYATGVTDSGGDENSGSGDDLSGLSISLDEDGGTLTVNGLDNKDGKGFWETIFAKYKVIILGISGIATLTFVILFIINFVKLGASGDNPQARRAQITACLWTGIATALCGSIMIVVGMFWNALKA